MANAAEQPTEVFRRRLLRAPLDEQGDDVLREVESRVRLCGVSWLSASRASANATLGIDTRVTLLSGDKGR